MRRALMAAAAVALLAGCSGGANRTNSVVAVRPLEFSTGVWDGALGGEGPVDAAKLDGLTDLPDGESAMTVARAVVQADLAGLGREQYIEYFRHTPGAQCRDVSVLAVSAYLLGAVEGVRFAKALAVWSGMCDFQTQGLNVVDVYLRNDSSAWEPVRHGDIPQSPERTGINEVPSWALRELACSKGLKARIEVAMAWEQMCAAAKSGGVELVAQSAWRSVEEQRALFERATEFYGSKSEARRYVADATTACESRHCAGEAIDARTDPAAIGWLQTVVACQRLDGTTVQARSCQETERAITNSERYGFSQAVATSPGHLEYNQVLNPLEGGACADTPSAQVPTLIVEVWRCALRKNGVVSEQVLKEALVVSECASAWNPSAREFDGRYKTEANPTSGRTYEGVGLFGVPADLVPAWVAGGSAEDAWANALAAARMYSHEALSGRDPWGWSVCARGDAVVQGVLGREFPEWVSRYVKQ